MSPLTPFTILSDFIHNNLNVLAQTNKYFLNIELILYSTRKQGFLEILNSILVYLKSLLPLPHQLSDDLPKE